MKKKAEEYRKQLEIQDPLVQRVGDLLAGAVTDYVEMLSNIENRAAFKHLPENSELKLVDDSIPRLGIVELDNGSRLIVRDGSEIQVPKHAREELIKVLHKTHSATDMMVLQCKNRIFWS